MKKVLFTVSLIAVLASTFAADQSEFKLPKEEVLLKPGPGSELVKSQCLLCHSTDYISTQPSLTRPQWTAIVEKMRAKYGAPIPTNNVEALVAYLTKEYGKDAGK